MLFTGEEVFFKHLLIKFDKIVLNYVKSGKKSRIFRFLKFDLDMMKIPTHNGVGRANSCFFHFIMKIDSYQRKSNWSENCHISSFYHIIRFKPEFLFKNKVFIFNTEKCNFFDQKFLLFYWWCLKSLKFYYFSCFYQGSSWRWKGKMFDCYTGY